MEAQVKKAVDEALASRGVSGAPPQAAVGDTRDKTELLFWARHDLEKELRRITQERLLTPGGLRPKPLMQLTRAAVQAGLIEPQLEHAIREVYAVCSPAIHGAPVTEAQLDFVRDVSPGLIAALRAIH